MVPAAAEAAACLLAGQPAASGGGQLPAVGGVLGCSINS